MGKRGKIKIVIFVNQLIESTISVFFKHYYLEIREYNKWVKDHKKLSLKVST